MYFKTRSGLLSSFQPYDSLQIMLSHWVGSDIHPIVPWALSFLNGSTIVGFTFGLIYRRLPSNSGVMKGLTFGVLAWVVMGLLFFPMLGLGPFAAQLGLGIWPALFSLAMLLTYSVVMGIVYAALNP